MTVLLRYMVTMRWTSRYSDIVRFDTFVSVLLLFKSAGQNEHHSRFVRSFVNLRDTYNDQYKSSYCVNLFKCNFFEKIPIHQNRCIPSIFWSFHDFIVFGTWRTAATTLIHNCATYKILVVMQVCSESVTSVQGGIVATPGYDEVVCSTYAGICVNM